MMAKDMAATFVISQTKRKNFFILDNAMKNGLKSVSIVAR